MKVLQVILIVGLIAVGGFYALNSYIYNEKQADDVMVEIHDEDVKITPISHASMVLEWDGEVLYVDPVGELEQYVGNEAPDVILLTDIHGDHLSIATLEGLVTADTIIVAPQAVADELTDELNNLVVIVANGEVFSYGEFDIEAIPMYNLPESEDSRHVKGRGNGYVVENDSTRLYIAGDTADIAEMRALQNIDIAFIPMNLPYTMDVNAAADAVLEFAPAAVYPYHYRTPEGFSDVDEFMRLVNEGNSAIDVVILDWYSN